MSPLLCPSFGVVCCECWLVGNGLGESTSPVGMPAHSHAAMVTFERVGRILPDSRPVRSERPTWFAFPRPSPQNRRRLVRPLVSIMRGPRGSGVQLLSVRQGLRHGEAPPAVKLGARAALEGLPRYDQAIAAGARSSDTPGLSLFVLPCLREARLTTRTVREQGASRPQPPPLWQPCLMSGARLRAIEAHTSWILHTVL